MKSRSVRTLAVLASAGLIVGAFVAGPAEAAKKKKKPSVCAAYVPGEQGAEAPTQIVTDAATAEAPVEIKVTAHEGIGVGGEEATETLIGHAFQNIQVDSANPTTALNVRLEMPRHEDYDLYINNPDGETAARAAGFNPIPAVYNDTEMGGHTEEGAEVIDALATNDCQGYTADIATASGLGGELIMKVWLGE